MTGPKRHPPRALEEVARLTRLLLEEPLVAGRLHSVRPDEATERWSGSTFLFGAWTDPDGPGSADAKQPAMSGLPVVVKLGTNEREVRWAQKLALHAPDLIPTVYAGGRSLGGEALPWLVMERCPYRLDYGWGDQLYTMLLDAGVRFQIASRRIAPPVGPADVEVELHCRLIRRGVTNSPPAPGPGRAVVERLERDWAWALSVCRVELCHGDLHPSNAVWRTAPPDPGSRALLIDYAPHALPWVSEPAYCRVLYWPGGRGPGHMGLVHEMAGLRRRYDLEVPSLADLDRLATVFLAWHALRLWPLLTHRHDNADYLNATRRWIEACATL
jgi:hypothetical protein